MIQTLLTTARIPYLVLLAIATAFFGTFAAGVPVEQSNESMNSFNPEQRAASATFHRLFGNDADLLLSVSHPRLLSAQGVGVLDEHFSETLMDELCLCNRER